MGIPEILNRDSIESALRAASRRSGQRAGWRFQEWEERWLRSDELSDLLAIHERLSESTGPDEFREVVDLFRHELRDLDEYRRGKIPKPLATARLLIALLDVNTERSPEVMEDLLNHPRLRASVRVGSQDPDHQRVIARAMTHPSMEGLVPSELIEAATALREASMDWSHASLFFTTDAAVLFREADNFEHKEERYSLGQMLALRDALTQEKSRRLWDRLREYPWSFLLDHWRLILAAASEALSLTEEEIAEAEASWRPNPPLRGRSAESRWQLRKVEEKAVIGDGDPTDNTGRFIVGNDPVVRIAKVKDASSAEDLANAFFEWGFQLTSHTTVIPSYLEATVAHPHFTVALGTDMLREGERIYGTEENQKLRAIVVPAMVTRPDFTVERAIDLLRDAERFATPEARQSLVAHMDAHEGAWVLEALPVEDRPYLDEGLMTVTLAVRKATTPEYIANLWKYVSHYYGESSNPMRSKLFEAFVKNKRTPEGFKAEAEEALRTPARQTPVGV